METWKNAPAPALVAKRLLECVTRRDVPPRYARTLNNLTHWGFGLATGAGYGLLVGSRTHRLWYGLPFGAAVWASGYAVLPRLGAYEPIWKYDLNARAGSERTSRLRYGHRGGIRLAPTPQDDRMTTGNVVQANPRRSS